METIFRFNVSALNSKFLATLKALFQTREIEITVTDVPNDETTFFLRYPENKVHLLEVINEVKYNKKLVRFTGAKFEKYSNRKL